MKFSMSKKEWIQIGKIAGWVKAAQNQEDDDLSDEKKLSEAIGDNVTLHNISVLDGLKSNIASIAQSVYNDWIQGYENEYDELNGGGICHLIADEIVSFLNSHDILSTSMHYEIGENHTAVVAVFKL